MQTLTELAADQAWNQLERIYGPGLGRMEVDTTLECLRVLVTLAQTGLGLGDLGSDTELIEPKHSQLYRILEPVRTRSEQLTLMRFFAELV